MPAIAYEPNLCETCCRSAKHTSRRFYSVLRFALPVPLPWPGVAVSGVPGADSSVARLPSRWLSASAMPNIPLFWATSFSAALLILEHLWIELPHAFCLLAAPVHDYPVLVVLYHLLDGDPVVFGTEIADPATRLDD